MSPEDKKVLLDKIQEMIDANSENMKKGLIEASSMVARDAQLLAFRSWIEKRFQDPENELEGTGLKYSFTHHEPDEALVEAVNHQMEDDGNVDDFVRRGIDDIVLKYAELGAAWKENKMMNDSVDVVVKTLVGSDRLVFIPRDKYALGEKVKILVMKCNG